MQFPPKKMGSSEEKFGTALGRLGAGAMSEKILVFCVGFL